MIHDLLHNRLARVADRFRRLWLLKSLAWCWGASALVALGLLWSVRRGAELPPMAGAALGGFTLLAAVVCWALSRRRARDPHWLAQKIELAHPQLQARLLAAVEQRPEGPSGEYGYLQETVIREALEDARRHGWEETVPTPPLAHGYAGAVRRFALCAFTWAGVIWREQASPVEPGLLNAKGTPAGQDQPYEVTVEPGDTEIERGASLLVLARFAGKTPPETSLTYQPSGADKVVSAHEQEPRRPGFRRSPRVCSRRHDVPG